MLHNTHCLTISTIYGLEYVQRLFNFQKNKINLFALVRARLQNSTAGCHLQQFTKKSSENPTYTTYL